MHGGKESLRRAHGPVKTRGNPSTVPSRSMPPTGQSHGTDRQSGLPPCRSPQVTGNVSCQPPRSALICARAQPSEKTSAAKPRLKNAVGFRVQVHRPCLIVKSRSWWASQGRRLHMMATYYTGAPGPLRSVCGVWLSSYFTYCGRILAKTTRVQNTWRKGCYTKAGYI